MEYSIKKCLHSSFMVCVYWLGYIFTGRCQEVSPKACALLASSVGQWYESRSLDLTPQILCVHIYKLTSAYAHDGHLQPRTMCLGQASLTNNKQLIKTILIMDFCIGRGLQHLSWNAASIVAYARGSAGIEHGLATSAVTYAHHKFVITFYLPTSPFS